MRISPVVYSTSSVDKKAFLHLFNIFVIFQHLFALEQREELMKKMSEYAMAHVGVAIKCVELIYMLLVANWKLWLIITLSVSQELTEFKHQRQPCVFSCYSHEFFLLLFFTLHHTVFSNGLNLVLQLFLYMNKFLLTWVETLLLKVGETIAVTYMSIFVLSTDREVSL